MDKLSCGLQPYAKSLNDKIDPPLKGIVTAAVKLDSVFTPKVYQAFYPYSIIYKGLYGWTILLSARVFSPIVELD